MLEAKLAGEEIVAARAAAGGARSSTSWRRSSRASPQAAEAEAAAGKRRRSRAQDGARDGARRSRLARSVPSAAGASAGAPGCPTPRAEPGRGSCRSCPGRSGCLLDADPDDLVPVDPQLLRQLLGRQVIRHRRLLSHQRAKKPAGACAGGHGASFHVSGEAQRLRAPSKSMTRQNTVSVVTRQRSFGGSSRTLRRSGAPHALLGRRRGPAARPRPRARRRGAQLHAARAAPRAAAPRAHPRPARPRRAPSRLRTSTGSTTYARHVAGARGARGDAPGAPCSATRWAASSPSGWPSSGRRTCRRSRSSPPAGHRLDDPAGGDLARASRRVLRPAQVMTRFRGTLRAPAAPRAGFPSASGAPATRRRSPPEAVLGFLVGPSQHTDVAQRRRGPCCATTRVPISTASAARRLSSGAPATVLSRLRTASSTRAASGRRSGRCPRPATSSSASSPRRAPGSSRTS